MAPNTDAKMPSYADILQDILTAADGPVSTEDLIRQVLEKHSTKAKDPYRAALDNIREERGRLLVFLDEGHVLPLRLAYQGARYRIRLTKEMIDGATLSVEKFFMQFLPREFNWENMRFLDAQGQPISVQFQQVPRTITFGAEQIEHLDPVIVLREWFRSQKMCMNDHLIVTIEDWEQGIFRLEREPFSDQHPELIAERDQILANLLYELLEAEKFKYLWVHVAVPTLYARVPDKGGYPADRWEWIVSNDPRMTTNGWEIRYADGDSPMDQVLAEISGKSLLQVGAEFTKEAGQQIYRFRAHLVRKPTLWRELEIEGKQTLADLDDFLRGAFQHDFSDHLSGFWKLVARGGRSRKQYREVDLGTINPFEDGEGEDTAIAALELQRGDQLKYVYDFGDWIEHRLELKSIGNPEKDIEYPREVARNKPKYEDCVECLKNGRQTAALWICHTCSQQEGTEIVLCEDCFNEHIEKNDDHYTDELLY